MQIYANSPIELGLFVMPLGIRQFRRLLTLLNGI